LAKPILAAFHDFHSEGDRMMTESQGEVSVEIRRLQGAEEAHECARLMADSEPWVTLRRTYDDSMRILNDPSREVYLAVVEEEMVGFTILQMRGAFVGYIQTVGVMPGWRNRGIGSRLIKFAEERIFSETPNVFLCVSSFNEGAQRLYKRLGYEVVGELKDYIVSGHSEMLLRKTIAPLAEYRRRKG
jgi:ribosomal-protein-alanine N-acetyltransferase